MADVIDPRCTFSHARVPSQILKNTGQVLRTAERETLWRLFLGIGRFWKIDGVNSFRSAWLEFIDVKTNSQPDFTAEYSSCASVIEELIHVYGDPAGLDALLSIGAISGSPETRYAHAKRFVADEFIRVLILLGGFKSFVDAADREEVNYRGYMGGSRYQRLQPVRPYR